MIKRPRVEPLLVGTNKTHLGHLEGGAAMTTILKCVMQSSYAQVLPTTHLRVMNPHLEHERFMAAYCTEFQTYAFQQGNSHISSFGFGGTNGHCIFWGQNTHSIPDIATLVLKKIKGAGPPQVVPMGASPDEWEYEGPNLDPAPGEKYSLYLDEDLGVRWVREAAEVDDVDGLDDDAFYCITGNFNNWTDDRMEEGDLLGLSSVTVEFPESGVLEFRFLRNGEEDEALGPAVPKCTKKSAAIEGPAASINTFWVVKGRPGTDLLIELFIRKDRRSVMWIKR